MFVAFTHGIAIPMLFPITFFGILNIYISEKLAFAYFYRQPPLFDNRLNDRALSLLKYAPILLMISAYWQLGNRQMFFNQPPSLDAKNIVMNPHHLLFDYSLTPNCTIMLLSFLPLILFSNLNQYLCQKWIYLLRIGKSLSFCD